MNFKLLFLSLFFTQILTGQTFTEASSALNFDGVSKGSIAFSDIDGDNDQDVLITGYNNSFEFITKLYTNDGMGNFTEMLGTPFDGVNHSSIAFSDVDGDNDQDVLITGMNGSFEIITKLYTNDGLGNFTEMLGTPFDGVRFGSIAFSDVDGDADQDVLITGLKDELETERITKLYTNDGQGNFFEVLDTSFDDVFEGSVAFSDVDGDNDQDVLITGAVTSGERISKLYTNDGLGNFTEMLGTPFDGVRYSSVAFSDVDGDDDKDVLITGRNNFDDRIAKLYINDGLGNFSEMLGTPFDGVWFSSIAFSDVDGDNDQDILLTGEVVFSMDDRIAKLYINDGLGNFTEMLETPFDGVWNSSITFSDVDGDNDQDVLITGENNLGVRIAKLYINNLMVSFADEVPLGFNFELIPYPSPATSNHLKIDFNSTQNGFVNVKVYGLNGELLSEQKEFAQVGPQTITVEIGVLSAGNYFIRLDNGKRIEVGKFIIN